MITPIPAFSDNYIWLLQTGAAADTPPVVAVVDPGDAEPVIGELERLGRGLDLVLVTHHHRDHVGGLAALKARYRCHVVGPENPAIDCVDERVSHGDRVQVGTLGFEVIAVPGHTLDHIAYFAHAPEPMLFCGDTLFAGGCGRVFEGTYGIMHESLGRLAALPDETRVFCAHEYTLANLRFASAVEPGNERLRTRVRAALAARERGEPTVPSTLALERDTNPFLRCHEASVLASAATHSGRASTVSEEVFAVLRQWKDNFR